MRRNQVDVGTPKVVLAQNDMSRYLASTEPQSTDFNISEDSFFSELTGLLKKEYVDPIKDETKLATGAVRGMVSSLGDANSSYMDAPEFDVYKKARQGQFEGIGADFVLRMENSQVKALRTTPTEDGPAEPAADDARSIPILTVVAVAPDGPAAKAGIKPGDWVESVNDHLVFNPKFMRDLRALQKKAEAGQIKADQIFELNQRFSDQLIASILPWKAKDKLMIGTSGTVKVTFNRAGSSFTRQIQKASSTLPAVAVQNDGVVAVRFYPGAADKLREAVDGKRQLTLDLRQAGTGSFDEMKKCLAIVAPAGTYGKIATKRKGVAAANMGVKEGNANPPQMTLLVDSTTRGPAEVFALALSSKGLATLKGEKMAGSREVIETITLPEGSGYTLVTGVYEPILGTVKGK